MAVALYMDVHVPWAITTQLRRRGVDDVTAIEDSSDELDDDQLLLRAAATRASASHREPAEATPPSAAETSG